MTEELSEQKQKGFTLSKLVTAFFMIGTIVAGVSLQIRTTQIMANRILFERDNILPQVELKGDTNRWYLIETTHEKALLIREKKKDEKKEVFKIVEVKEMNKIISVSK